MSSICRVNKLITIKLENGKTNIYVGGTLFRQCKYLLIEISDVNSFDDFSSIDQIIEKSLLLIESRKRIQIPKEVEFWGHCSNIQAWVENEYNTEILDSSLSFPILKRLCELGDLKALKVFNSEVIRRFLKGGKITQEFLCEEGYLEYITPDEKYSLIPDETEMAVIKSLEKDYGIKMNIDTVYMHFSEFNGFILDGANITKIYFNDTQLNNIPSQLQQLSHLKEIQFSNANIDSIPEWIGYLPDLQKISLANLKIRKLPETIGLLSELESIYISSLPLESVPLSIGNLTKLKSLSIVNTLIQEIPETISKCTSLQIMFLDYNKITTIPYSISKLNKLERLHLRWNNLKHIPELVKEMPNLIINIEGNFIPN